MAATQGHLVKKHYIRLLMQCIRNYTCPLFSCNDFYFKSKNNFISKYYKQTVLAKFDLMKRESLILL